MAEKFPQGGIIAEVASAIIGELGREVIRPLTKPERRTDG